MFAQEIPRSLPAKYYDVKTFSTVMYATLKKMTS